MYPRRGLVHTQYRQVIAMISKPTSMSSPMIRLTNRLVLSSPSVMTVWVDVPVTSIDVSDATEVGVSPPGWVNRRVLVVSSMLSGVCSVESVTDVDSVVSAVVSVVVSATASDVAVVDDGSPTDVDDAATLDDVVEDDSSGATVTVVVTSTVVDVSWEAESASVVGGDGSCCADAEAARNDKSISPAASTAMAQTARARAERQASMNESVRSKRAWAQAITTHDEIWLTDSTDR